MGITLSIHAKEQASERGIEESGVIAIITGSPAVTMPSKRDPEAVIMLGRHAGKIWGVVFNDKTQNVITVRLASKKERRIYGQETGN